LIILINNIRFRYAEGIDFFLKSCYSITKCSRRCYPYIITGYKNFTYECGQAEETDLGGKGVSMGERKLLKGMRPGVLSSLSFTSNNGVRYFDQAWLRKATDIVGGKRGNI